LFSSAVHQLAFTLFSSLPFAVGQVSFDTSIRLHSLPLLQPELIHFTLHAHPLPRPSLLCARVRNVT
jgi:hypothetical protein